MATRKPRAAPRRKPKATTDISAQRAVQSTPAPTTGLWLQRFVDPDLRLSHDERLSESAVYAAIRQIVDPLAAADWNVVIRDRARRSSLGDSNLWYMLNVRPNADQPASAVKESLATSAIVGGSGYWAINRDNAARATELWPLEFNRVAMIRDPATQELFYRYSQPNGGETYLRGSDVVHARGPTISGLNGDSLVDRASPAISLAVAQARFASSFFQNAGVLSGYLKLPNPVSDPDVIARLKADWSSKYSGRRAHSTAVIEGGGEYVPLSTDAEKAQLRESRELSVQDIARYFNVPLVLLCLAISAQGYGTNTTQFFEMFVRTCLRVWKRRLEEEVTFKLCPQATPWPEVSIDLGFLTRGNAKERAETNEILIRSGQLTPNEARADEGRDSMRFGDVLLLGTKLLEDVVDPPEPAPAPAAPAMPSSGGKPNKAPEMDDDMEEGDMEDGMNALLRGGVALALENHRRRWVGRARDVSPEQLAASREGLRCKLASDLVAFDDHLTDEQIASLAEQVEAGVEPAKAVAPLCVRRDLHPA